MEFPAVSCTFDATSGPWTLKGLKTSSGPPGRYCQDNGDVLNSEYVYFCPNEYSGVSSVAFKGWEIEGRLNSQYAVYKIHPVDNDGETWTVRHRYSEFYALKEALCERYGKTRCADDIFPKKKWVGNLKVEFLRQRENALKNWMHRILQVTTKFDDDIREFLDACKGVKDSTKGTCNCMTPFTVDFLNAKRPDNECVPICGRRQDGFLFEFGSGKCLHKE